MGIYSALDFDEFSAFDLGYEYDVREAFDKYLQGKIALSHYLDMLNFQEAMYPANYNKLRFLETTISRVSAPSYTTSRRS